ncbi:Uncharacterized protein APZ42_004156 [Daphnia magna]|uniref:HAT C-terminal dimerisation domain-containing protein n=1 Tax=Daphnia magna TaxID=35525 RepID=A0A164H8D8_9CRUS|nr:Uncharacterized protein APZ42_004156 [Daphnia magna]
MRHPDSLIKLFKQYPNLPKDKEVNASLADREWRSHSYLEPILLQCHSEDEQAKISQSQLLYFFSFSMPFSNLTAEREFSAFKLIKTDRRNLLNNVSVTSLMQIKHWGVNEDHSASNVLIKKALIDKVKSVKANLPIPDQTQGL